MWLTALYPIKHPRGVAIPGDVFEGDAVLISAGLATASLVAPPPAPVDTTLSITAAQISDAGAGGLEVLKKGSVPEIAALVSWDKSTSQRIRRMRDRIGKESLNLTQLGNSIVIGSSISGKPPFGDQMSPISDMRFSGIANKAVGGHKSIDIINIQLPTIPVGTEALMVMEGTNDATAGVPVATHIQQMHKILRYGIDNFDAVPLLVSTPPNSEVSAKPFIEKYALAQRLYAEDHAIPFADPWGAYTDVDGTLADAVQGDGKHFNIVLHSYAARECLAQFTGRPSPLIPRSDTDKSGLIQTNALMTTDTTSSGVVVPTGWALASAAGVSGAMSAATLPVRGRWFDISMSSVAAASSINATRELGNPLSYGNVGDVLRIAGYFRFANTANVNAAARLWVGATPANVAKYLFDTPVGFDPQYFSAEVQIPPNTTGTSKVFLTATSADGSNVFTGSVGVACVQVYNVTRARFVADFWAAV